MCVALPGRVVKVEGGSGPSRPAVVMLSGRETEVDLIMVPEADVGDYVIVHSGYAVSSVTPEEATRTQELLDSITDG